MRTNLFSTATILIVLLFSNCSPSSEHSIEINDLRLIDADQTPSEWLSYGKNYQENRHSSLNQINKLTIDSLGLAWSINLETKRGLEATPIVANGVMYFTGTWSKVYAVDIRKGEIMDL